MHSCTIVGIAVYVSSLLSRNRLLFAKNSIQIEISRESSPYHMSRSKQCWSHVEKIQNLQSVNTISAVNKHKLTHCTMVLLTKYKGQNYYFHNITLVAKPWGDSIEFASSTLPVLRSPWIISWWWRYSIANDISRAIASILAKFGWQVPSGDFSLNQPHSIAFCSRLTLIRQDYGHSLYLPLLSHHPMSSVPPSALMSKYKLTNSPGCHLQGTLVAVFQEQPGLQSMVTDVAIMKRPGRRVCTQCLHADCISVQFDNAWVTQTLQQLGFCYVLHHHALVYASFIRILDNLLQRVCQKWIKL